MASALDAADIPFAFTGAIASAYHGYARATQDLDVKVRVDRRERVEDAFRFLPAGSTHIDDLSWRIDERWDVELYPLLDALDRRAFEGRLSVRLFEDDAREFWVVPLEALLVLKVREHLKHPSDLKHVDDVRKLVARNHDKLDLDELERLLDLDPRWRKAWEELIEPGPM